MVDRNWTIVRFPDGSWSGGGSPDDPDYEHCEVWQVVATDFASAVAKAQASRSASRRRVKRQVETAKAWRVQHGYVGREGVVVLYKGKAQGWVNILRNPDHWRPGCVAIDEIGRTWTATAGTDNGGALIWLPNFQITDRA